MIQDTLLSTIICNRITFKNIPLNFLNLIFEFNFCKSTTIYHGQVYHGNEELSNWHHGALLLALQQQFTSFEIPVAMCGTLHCCSPLSIYRFKALPHVLVRGGSIHCLIPTTSLVSSTEKEKYLSPKSFPVVTYSCSTDFCMFDLF